MALVLVLGTAGLAPPVEVSGDEVCPTPAARLAELSGPDDTSPARLRAFVSRVKDEVHIDLVDAAGVRVAERSVARRGACPELARVVAVVIAAWAAEIATPGDLSLAPPPSALARSPAPQPALPRSASLAAVVSVPPTPRTQYVVTLGLLASLAGGQLAEGAEIALSARRPSWPLGPASH